MDSDILVSLLKTTVLGNVVKVVPTYNNGALHLGGNDLSVEDTPADGYVSGERTLLVYEGSLDSSIGGLNSKTDITGETHALLALGANNALTSYEDSVLALVSIFVLITLFVCGSNTRSHVELLLYLKAEILVGR